MNPEDYQNLQTLQKMLDERDKLLLLKDPKNLKEEEKGSLGSFIGNVFLGATNEALLGIPNFLLDRKNQHLFKKPEATSDKVAKGIGSIIGFSVGLPAKLLTKVAGKTAKFAGQVSKNTVINLGMKTGVKETILAREALRGAIQGGAAFGALEAATLPTGDEKIGDKLIDIPISAALGGAFGLASPLVMDTVKQTTPKVKMFLDGKIDKEQIKGLGKEFADNLMGLDKGIRAGIKVAQKNQDWKKANEIIQRSYVGTKKELLDKVNVIKKTDAFKRTKEGIEALKSNDYIIKTNAVLKDFTKSVKDTDIFKTLETYSRKGPHQWLVTTGAQHFWNQNGGGKKIVHGFRRIEEFVQSEAGELTQKYRRMFGTFTKAEMQLFTKAVEGDTIPTGKIADAVKLWQKDSTNLLNELNKAGINTQKRSGFLPHMQIDDLASKDTQREVLQAVMQKHKLSKTQAENLFDSWNNWLKDTGKNQSPMINHIMKTNPKMTKEQAIESLQNIAKSRRFDINKEGGELTRMFGSAENQRTINLPFYDRNPERAITRYIHAQKQKVGEIAYWGNNNQKLEAYKQEFIANGGDRRMANYLEQAMTGKLGQGNAFGVITPETSIKLRGIQVVTKLGLASIANASQSVGTATFTNIKDTSKNLAKYIFSSKDRAKMQDIAQSMGVTFEGSMSTIMQGLGSDGTFTVFGHTIKPNKFLEKTGFLAIERMNRVVAAHAGKDFAIRMAGKLMENPKNKVAQRALRRMGVNWKSVIDNQGKLTPQQIGAAARQTERATQFQSKLIDLPLWWSSPEGKLMTQFKVFSYKQAQLIKTAVLDEAARGNMKPLATALIAMPFIGEGVKNARSIVTFRARDEKGLERLAENYAAVGAGGIFADILQQNKFGNIPNWLIGPTGSDVGKAVDAGVKLAFGKETKAENMLVRNIPIAGPALMNLRRSNDPQKRLQDILEGVRGN